MPIRPPKAALALLPKKAHANSKCFVPKSVGVVCPEGVISYVCHCALLKPPPSRLVAFFFFLIIMLDSVLAWLCLP